MTKKRAMEPNTVSDSITKQKFSTLNPLLLPLPWLAVIGLLLVFGLMHFTGGHSPDAETPQAQTIQFPQIYLTGVEMREFDEQGALRYQLNTPLVRRFQIEAKASPKDYTLFDKPHIIFAGNSTESAWDITANLGRSDADSNIYTLSDQVMAEQQSPTRGLTTITTSEITVNAHEQFAQTAKAVTMRTAKNQLTTVGLHADIKKDQIKLLSQVKGIYEP